jgi:hypothetical protein
VSEPSGLLLEVAAGRAPATALDMVNAGLANYGSRVWPLDLTGVALDLRKIVVKPNLTKAEVDHVKEHFLLSREQLLRLIGEAGRTPHIPGGGSMIPFVENRGYAYPQLYVVGADSDYRHFDRLHVNTADDGTGVDEIGQLLSGGGVRIVQDRPGLGTAILHLSCPSADFGWIVTYDGGAPHIGSLSGTSPGTKFLMQVIGPERWSLRYQND